MLAHSPQRAAARRITIHQVSLLSRRTPPAHRCPRRRRRRRQRQRVTEGTAMAPWNGPNKQGNNGVAAILRPDTPCTNDSSTFNARRCMRGRTQTAPLSRGGSVHKICRETAVVATRRHRGNYKKTRRRPRNRK